MSVAVPVAGPRAGRAGALAAAFATIYLVWGSTYLAIRLAIETLPPFLMTGGRFLIAGAALYALARGRGAAPPTRAQWRGAAVAGSLLMVGGAGLLTWSEHVVPSGTAALVMATVILWVTLLDWLLCGGPRPTRSVAAGLVAGLAGVAVLVGPDAGAGPAVGLTAVLLAAVSWAGGTLYGRGARLPPSPLLSASLQMLTGGLALLAVGTAAGEWARLDLGAVSARSALAVAYLIVFDDVLAFAAYVWLVRATSASAAATYAFVNPVIAVLLGSAVLGEPLGPRTALATALILVAVALVLPRRRVSLRGGGGLRRRRGGSGVRPSRGRRCRRGGGGRGGGASAGGGCRIRRWARGCAGRGRWGRGARR